MTWGRQRDLGSRWASLSLPLMEAAQLVSEDMGFGTSKPEFESQIGHF